MTTTCKFCGGQTTSLICTVCGNDLRQDVSAQAAPAVAPVKQRIGSPKMAPIAAQVRPGQHPGYQIPGHQMGGAPHMGHAPHGGHGQDRGLVAPRRASHDDHHEEGLLGSLVSGLKKVAGKAS